MSHVLEFILEFILQLVFECVFEPLAAILLKTTWAGIGVVVDAIAFPMLYLATWRQHRSRRWAGQGRCEGCGYSLRGNISGACPECGRPAPPAKPG